jgi:hypothetical protein
LNVTQWNTLKARMQALRADWLAVESAEGE